MCATDLRNKGTIFVLGPAAKASPDASKAPGLVMPHKFCHAVSDTSL